MRLFTVYCGALGVLAACAVSQAATIHFDTAPFAGTNVLNIPGRQIVGGEKFISFSPSQDIFSLDSPAFGVAAPVNFANGPASTIPASGVNAVVLEDFDNDANPLTPFGAGNAADLIASRITTPGPGFFIYFNQGLDLPRLVYSTDLSDNTADLQILARILNLNGQGGRDALTNFTSTNFEITANPVPEPSSLLLIAGVCLIGAAGHFGRCRRIRTKL